MESQPKAEVHLDHSSHMDLKSDARLKAENKDCKSNPYQSLSYVE